MSYLINLASILASLCFFVAAGVNFLWVYRSTKERGARYDSSWELLTLFIAGFFIAYLLTGWHLILASVENGYDFMMVQIFLWTSVFIYLCARIFERTTGTLCHDIDQKSRMEREILALASYPQTNPNPIIELDCDGHVVFLNESAKRTFPRLQVTGHPQQVFEGVTKLRKKLLKFGQITREVRLRDGSEFSQTVQYLPVECRFRIHLVNMTELRRTREELKGAQETYREFIDHLPVGVYRDTPGSTGHFLEANEAIAAIFEADSKEQFMAGKVSDLYQDAKDRAVFSDLISKQGYVKDMVLQMKTLKGRPFLMKLTAIARKNKKGEVLFFDGIVQDMTAIGTPPPCKC